MCVHPPLVILSTNTIVIPVNKTYPVRKHTQRHFNDVVPTFSTYGGVQGVVSS